jgi:tRNA 2-thiouridine synthesizing protein A
MTETQIEVTQELDARGLLCPMPVIKLAKAVKALAPGEVLKLLATDRGSIADIPAWSESTGNELLDWHDEGDFLVFFVRKGEET